MSQQLTYVTKKSLAWQWTTPTVNIAASTVESCSSSKDGACQ